MRIKIEIELIENCEDKEELKEVVYAYLMELIKDDSLSFDVLEENPETWSDYIGAF